MSLYLTIDIGTSSAKVALFEQGGTLLTSNSSSYPVYYPQPGWAEQNTEDWWSATQGLCKKVLREAGYPPLRSVCISGQAPLCVPVDRRGHALRPAILWLDRRSHPQVKWLRDRLGGDPANGNRLDSYFGGLKWLWFLQNEPYLYRKTWKILQANGFVLYRLTGVEAIDPSHAGLCSPCFNLRERNWDEETCEKMGLDIRKLPTVHPSTQIVGQVSLQASTLTGIPSGTPVVCGGADFACACLGAGAMERGSAAMMLGTAGNLLVPAPKRTDDRLLNTVHLTGEGLSLGGVLAGGAVQCLSGVRRHGRA